MIHQPYNLDPPYLLQTAGNLIPNGIRQDVDEEVVGLCRTITLGYEDHVVTPLHDILL